MLIIVLVSSMYDLKHIKPKPTGIEKEHDGTKQPTILPQTGGLLSSWCPEGLEGRVTEIESRAKSPREVKDRPGMKNTSFVQM